MNIQKTDTSTFDNGSVIVTENPCFGAPDGIGSIDAIGVLLRLTEQNLPFLPEEEAALLAKVLRSAGDPPFEYKTITGAISYEVWHFCETADEDLKLIGEKLRHHVEALTEVQAVVLFGVIMVFNTLVNAERGD